MTRTSSPIERLKPNPLNPRGPVEPSMVDELAASIRELGVLQPLLVTPDGTVVAGHRRLAAAQLVGLKVIPIREQILGTAHQIEIMLAENIQREDLTPLQEARAYRELLKLGLTQADVARQVGVTGSRVQSRLAVLKLCPEVQELYASNLLPTTIASSLARVADPRQQQRFANMAARRQIPAPKIEQLIKQSLGEQQQRSVPAAPSVPDVQPIAPAGISTTRKQVIDQLQSEPETTISFEDIAKAVADTCCWCGMDSMPEVCGNCPMPQLVARIVRAA